jgi:hypothetical protein
MFWRLDACAVFEEERRTIGAGETGKLGRGLEERGQDGFGGALWWRERGR